MPVDMFGIPLKYYLIGKMPLMWMAWVTLDTDLLKMKRKRIMKKYS